MVINSVKMVNLNVRTLSVPCRKRSAFDIKFDLILVSIFLKTCVKDHERFFKLDLIGQSNET